MRTEDTAGCARVGRSRAGLALAVVLALIGPSVAQQADAEPGAESTRTPEQNGADEHLRFRVTALSTATSEGILPVQIGIRNATSEPISFVFSRIWVPHTSWVSLDAGSDGPIGGRISSSMHKPVAGEEFCPAAETVYGLAPDAEMHRGAEIRLGDLLVGRASLRVSVELIRVRPDMGCAPTVYIEGDAETMIDVVPE